MANAAQAVQREVICLAVIWLTACGLRDSGQESIDRRAGAQYRDCHRYNDMLSARAVRALSGADQEKTAEGWVRWLKSRAVSRDVMGSLKGSPAWICRCFREIAMSTAVALSHNMFDAA